VLHVAQSTKHNANANACNDVHQSLIDDLGNKQIAQLYNSIQSMDITQHAGLEKMRLESMDEEGVMPRP